MQGQKYFYDAVMRTKTNQRKGSNKIKKLFLQFLVQQKSKK